MAKKQITINYDYCHVPTVKRFSDNDKFIRGLMGPFGSGKSVGCVIEIIKRSLAQKPGADGIRRSRWAVIRNSYPQLRDTTIRTVLDWLPQNIFGKFLKQTHDYTIDQIPGTHLEIMFRALDRPDHIANLLSLELTGAWVNEAREVPEEIIHGLTGRVGRYPSKRDGGASWFGIIMDTNPPDDDSWWYKLFEETKPQNAAIFKQPSGLSDNPENIQNLPNGYYQNLSEGKDQEWISVYCGGQYGMLKDGRPVYPDFQDVIHTHETNLLPMKDVAITLGWDFGLTPACVVCQLLPNGRFMIIDEMVSEVHASMGIRQFSQEVVRPHLQNYYQDWIDKRIIQSYGDPAGNQRTQTDEMTCLMILNGDAKDIDQSKSLGKIGIITGAASTNSPIARQDAVKFFLNNKIDGKPRLLISPDCKVLRKGFRGAYQYARVLVSGEKRYKDQPAKNHYSHIHDALQYAALMSLPEEWQAKKKKSSAELRIERLINGNKNAYEELAVREQDITMRELEGEVWDFEHEIEIDDNMVSTV